jgi:hypothetical protein
MSTLLEKLNLRPQELRLVVGATAILFVVLHFWFIQPYFKEWRQTEAALDKAKRTLVAYESVFAQTNEYRRKLEKLEEQGTGLLNPEQAGSLLIRRIGDQARESKVNQNNIQLLRGGGSRANEFFEEQVVDFRFNPTGDKELIDFLVAIGNSDLMVRVKELNLGPDPSQTKLVGSMRLVASFQKKTSGGPATVKPAATNSPSLSSTQP